MSNEDVPPRFPMPNLPPDAMAAWLKYCDLLERRHTPQEVDDESLDVAMAALGITTEGHAKNVAIMDALGSRERRLLSPGEIGKLADELKAVAEAAEATLANLPADVSPHAINQARVVAEAARAASDRAEMYRFGYAAPPLPKLQTWHIDPDAPKQGEG